MIARCYRKLLTDRNSVLSPIDPSNSHRQPTSTSSVLLSQIFPNILCYIRDLEFRTRESIPSAIILWGSHMTTIAWNILSTDHIRQKCSLSLLLIRILRIHSSNNIIPLSRYLAYIMGFPMATVRSIYGMIRLMLICCWTGPLQISTMPFVCTQIMG